MNKRKLKVKILTKLLEKYTGKKVIFEKQQKQENMPEFLKYDNLFKHRELEESTTTEEPKVKPSPIVKPEPTREPKRSPLLPKNPPKVLPKPKA